MSWANLIHLGDLPLTMAAAAAALAWMVASRIWRLAFWWSVLFLLAIALVTATKVAFLVWGASSPMPEFRALSGHATGATAVCVIVLYLAAHAYASPMRSAGILTGLALGAMMGLLLVLNDEHSVAEAAAGWSVGALASVGAIHLAGEVHAPVATAPISMLWAGAVFLACTVLLRQLPIGYLMWRVAKVVARHAGALAIVGV
ncbi:hypothetical protein [Massilia sp. DWR3-1-1]|uniref:hypothetical protein n=1 Tax=Massilia sp. DWR3-1-1 TaxID=2804559 RepID=UPI003CE69A23